MRAASLRMSQTQCTMGWVEPSLKLCRGCGTVSFTVSVQKEVDSEDHHKMVCHRQNLMTAIFARVKECHCKGNEKRRVSPSDLLFDWSVHIHTVFHRTQPPDRCSSSVCGAGSTVLFSRDETCTNKSIIVEVKTQSPSVPIVLCSMDSVTTETQRFLHWWKPKYKNTSVLSAIFSGVNILSLVFSLIFFSSQNMNVNKGRCIATLTQHL